MTTAALFAGHAPVLPIVLPLVAGALLVVLEQARSRAVPAFALAATLLLAALSALLFARQAGGSPIEVVLLGNWPAPWGIVLVLDRLAAAMVALTALVALAAQVQALAPGARGPHFHSLLQFQLMGLNGAFLAGDLFNLFVFFEVLLAASYGLLLQGGGPRRETLRAGLRYVVLNLAGSALFLVAAALFYGSTGTLNLADLAQRLPALADTPARLAAAAGALLLVVFALKAALLPLGFWLVGTYASAAAPAAAVFVLLTKVGVVSIVRTGSLGLLPTGGPLLALALATLAVAAVGTLGARHLRSLVAALVAGTAGTLMVAVALGTPAALAAALFYAVQSSLATAAAFLLAERIASSRGASDRLEAAPLADGWAVLGGTYLVVAVASAGLPPLAGFLGKAWLLQAAGAGASAVPVVATLTITSLVAVVALARGGSALFWQRPRPAAALRPAPAAHGAIALLLAAMLACAVHAGALAAYCEATARQLADRDGYAAAVFAAPAAAPAWDLRREMRERGDAK